MWVIVRRVAQTIAMATAMRARLDDTIGFNLDDLMMTETCYRKSERVCCDINAPEAIEAVEPAGF
jgi:hypothetical protein